MPRQVQKCPFEGCHKTFTHLNNFWYHINMHKGEKPAKCTLCPQAFRSDSHLRQHLKKKHQVDQHQNGLEEHSNKRKISSSSQPDFGKRVKLTEKKPMPSSKSNSKNRPRQFSPAQAVVRNKHSKSIQPTGEYGNQKCYNVSRTQENNIRIKNQAESCSWKKDMQHLFFIPYNALNPEFLFDFESDVHRYWYRPLNSFYSGYIPITRLPVHCRVVHDVSTSIHVKISSGWEKALIPESDLRRFTGYKVKQETSSSDVLPSAEFKQSTVGVGHLSSPSTNNQFRNMPPHFSDQRQRPPSQAVVNGGSLLECGYCGKYFYDEDAFCVHIAVHKGYGFKFSKCKVCGKRFLDKLKFEAHLKLHVIKTSPSSSPCLPVKITFDKASKKKQCKYCTFSTRNMHLFRMHFSRHSM